MGTIGFGTFSEYSRSLIPWPPQNRTTFIKNADKGSTIDAFRKGQKALKLIQNYSDLKKKLNDTGHKEKRQWSYRKAIPNSGRRHRCQKGRLGSVPVKSFVALQVQTPEFLLNE